MRIEIEPNRENPELFQPYRISWIFRLCLIFTEFATSLKLQKIETAKSKPYYMYMSSLRVLEIAKLGLGDNLAHLRIVIFAKISRHENVLVCCNATQTFYLSRYM